ncbi:hypothetical protein KBC99_00325 [Candidatus Saccharibacteria bacterium]|nr:hypothetical protein [Candidatus Saccharibacteria bacterium]
MLRKSPHRKFRSFSKEDIFFIIFFFIIFMGAQIHYSDAPINLPPLRGYLAQFTNNDTENALLEKLDADWVKTFDNGQVSWLKRDTGELCISHFTGNGKTVTIMERTVFCNADA